MTGDATRTRITAKSACSCACITRACTARRITPASSRRNSSEKTGKTGREFIDFIQANPGYDVYFINPFPQNAYYTYNVWVHGDYCHPGLMALAHRLFYLAGIPFNITGMGRNDAAHAALLELLGGQ